jgi:hypothetical protein
MALFSTANAAEMARRSHAARKLREAERKAQSALPPASAAGKADENQAGVSVSRVRARLQTLDALMAKAKSDREWDNLSRAFDRLFRVWCVLTGTPGPGNRKPSEPKRGSRLPWDLDPLVELSELPATPQPGGQNSAQSV